MCVCVFGSREERETRCLTRVFRKWLRNLAREEEKETRSLFVNCFTDSFPPSLVCPFRRTGWPFGRDSLEGLALDSQLFSSLLVCRVMSAVCMSSKDEFRAPALGLFFGYLAVLTLLLLLLLFAGRFFGWRRVLISVLHVWLFPPMLGRQFPRESPGWNYLRLALYWDEFSSLGFLRSPPFGIHLFIIAFAVTIFLTLSIYLFILIRFLTSLFLRENAFFFFYPESRVLKKMTLPFK